MLLRCCCYSINCGIRSWAFFALMVVVTKPHRMKQHQQEWSTTIKKGSSTSACTTTTLSSSRIFPRRVPRFSVPLAHSRSLEWALPFAVRRPPPSGFLNFVRQPTVSFFELRFDYNILCAKSQILRTPQAIREPRCRAWSLTKPTFNHTFVFWRNLWYNITTKGERRNITIFFKEEHQHETIHN